MPRPSEDTRLRRILMQSIMWIVLAATVALAALVDQSRNRSAAIELSEPLQLSGLSIQLPVGWVGMEDLEANPSVVVVKEPFDASWARLIRVSFRRPSIAAALGALSGVKMDGITHETRSIRIGDADGNLVIRRVVLGRSPRGSLYQTQLAATRQVADGRVLTIALNSFARSKKDVENDVQIIRRVAESVKFDEAQ